MVPTLFSEKKLIKRFHELQDNQGGSFLLFCATSRWLSLRLDIIIATYVTILSFAFIPLSKNQMFSDLFGLSPGTGLSFFPLTL